MTQLKRAGRVVVLVAFMCGYGEVTSAAEEKVDEPGHGIFGDRFSLDVGMKFWVAKWQAQGNAREISATRTSDTTTLMGPASPVVSGCAMTSSSIESG